jgi:exodeoxyribonuclease VII large subunit
MTDDSYQFSGMSNAPGPAADNAPAYSVSELSAALKRTVEDAYGFVRLRGEISKVTRHASGHVYLTLKDERACIDGVVWKGSVRGLQAQPEQGLEVIVTGRITTYPARSSYQIVIETMEPAGVGALLAQLERLKARLDAEGLFASERKRRIPAYPAIVGVVTSPTGAVIRDILHRIRDRWPCHVIVWPVVVQGEVAAAQAAAAVRGFNAMSGAARPDVLIVARGGGSIEDLWPFNDEALARTVAEGSIPLVSAVGHETDTTLIDFVSDRRAPTPTGAAEMATPVLAELRALTADFESRLRRCSGRMVEDARTRLQSAARGLPRPQQLLETASQRLDIAVGRLGPGLERNAAVHERRLVAAASRLAPGLLTRQTQQFGERLSGFAERARRALDATLRHDVQRLDRAGRLLETLNPKRPPGPGMARVLDAAGNLVLRAADLAGGQAVSLRFADGERGAVIDGAAAPVKSASKPKAAPAPSKQGDLF